MSGNWSGRRGFIRQQTAFEPENDSYNAQLLGFFNTNLLHVFTMRAWTFARKVAVIPVYADVATGTVTLTNGSRSVVGSGTAWTTAMEGCYLQTGTSAFNPGRWVRIGRVSSATVLLLESPYPFAGVAGVAHTIRQRYVPMPRDCVRYQTVTDANADRGMLAYRNPYEVDRIYLDEDVGGTPFWYTDAPSYNPPTPERALTATLTAGGALVSGRTYQWKYTWRIGDAETGASNVVEATPSGANLSVNLTGMQEIAGNDGRYLRLYQAEKDVGIFYLVGEYSAVSAGTPIPIADPITDRTTPYVDGNQTQFIRVFPRNNTDSTIYASVRYHYRPREIQKDSDYPDMPTDCEEAITALTIANVLDTQNNPSGAATWRNLAAARIRTMEGTYMAQEPEATVRRTWIGSRGGYRAYIPNPTIT